MKRLFCTIMMAAAALVMKAQNVTDLVISEVMVDNHDSVTDDFGRHPAWIELLNSSWGSVNIGGCFWTDDISDLTKSPILRGDSRTRIGPRQATLFYEGGEGVSGAFYLNFTLKPGSTLYLVSSNGRTVIDSILIPGNLPAGKSVSRYSTDARGMVFDREEISDPSPMAMNGAGLGKSGAESIRERDPHGWVLTITCVTVVFAALLLLYFIYSLLGRFFTGGISPKREKAQTEDMTPEVAAAIAMALHLHLGEDIHDSESFVLTMKQSASAWNDRSLTIRKKPLK